MSATQSLAFFTVKMNVKDAETFIRNVLENDIRGSNNIQVQIEPTVRQFELFPCLMAAQNASMHTAVKINSPKIEAIKALRDAARDRGMEIGLADAKSVVEAFIEV